MNALPTSPSKIIPVCSSCATTVTEGTADVYWDTDKQRWCIAEISEVAWCEGCEESGDWHFANVHDIEEPPSAV